ncbi:MAG: ComEC/Rec2 family competence protein [Chlorobiales bacterium]|nr:ComEC/Rec2 family competence protein [Chlorobiales bacterium]
MIKTSLTSPYPAVRLLFFVCGGIVTGLYSPLSVFIWIVLSLACLLVLCAFLLLGLKKTINRENLSLSAIVAYSFFVFSSFGAYSNYAYRYVASDTVLNYLGKEVLLYGKVVSRPRISAKGAQWILDVREVFADGETRKASGKVKVFLRLYDDKQPDVEAGDMVRIKGRTTRISDAANPGDFDAHDYYWKQGVHAELYCPGPWMMRNYGLDKSDVFEGLLVRPVRRYLSGAIDGLVPPGHERQFLKGIFLGEREMLDREVYRQFQAAGTAHVLAISGLHVGLVVVAMLVLMQRLRTTVTGRWAVLLLIAAVLLVYSSVTGNAPSVRRASIMAVVLIGGSVIGRRSFPLNSLAAADLVILSLDPLELFSAGFLMTNTAVASIILLYPALSRPSMNWSSITGVVFRPVWNAFSVSLAAIIGVSPVIAWFFGTFSLAGLLANLPVVFLVSSMLYAMLPAFVLNLVLPGLAIYFASSAWFFAKAALEVTEFFGSQHWALAQMQPDVPGITVYYAAILATLYFLHREKPAFVVITMLFAANYFAWTPVLRAESPPPVFAQAAVGKDTALICSVEGSSILIDCGSKPYHQETIRQQMRRYGIKQLDAAVQFASPDSLVAAIGASGHLLSDDRHMALPSFVLARLNKDILKLWTSDGSSLLLAADLNALMSLGGNHIDRAVLKVKRFGINDYRGLQEWLDKVLPRECVVLCSSRMPERDRGLLLHLAGRRKEMTVVD